MFLIPQRGSVQVQGRDPCGFQLTVEGRMGSAPNGKANTEEVLGGEGSQRPVCSWVHSQAKAG